MRRPIRIIATERLQNQKMRLKPITNQNETIALVRERERDLESAGGEFDADGGFGFEAELVSGESGEQIGFADARIAD